MVKCCSLCGTDWVLNYCFDKIRLQRAKFEVFTAVRLKTFWTLVLCKTAGGRQRFGEKHCRHLQGFGKGLARTCISVFNHEYGDSMFQ
jgi:hypothetical protein